MIFHIDANSFYASCEQVFRPDLQNKPVAVLSNNDGITIALNQECKNLGFKRGDTYFKLKDDYRRKGVTVFSSNYTLYADMSRRLNLLYAQYSPEVEQYSIDESFLIFPDCTNGGYTETANELRQQALKQVHIPVSVGIAPTKTLAKMCNKLAKKYGGVCNWNEVNHRQILDSYPAADVWGIGRSKAAILARYNIRTAAELARFPAEKALAELTITGYRTVRELNEVAMIDYQGPENRQNVTSSRSFARGVTALSELETALAEYTQLAVSRMRSEHLACRIVSIMIMTARAYTADRKDQEYYNAASAELPSPSSYLPAVYQTALRLLRSVYRSGFLYRKIMVNLLALENDETIQQDLFDTRTPQERARADKLMAACDSINELYGRGAITVGSRYITKGIKQNGMRADWIMNRQFLSPEYTTDLASVPEVHAWREK